MSARAPAPSVDGPATVSGFRVHGFSCARSGSRPDENEDAWALGPGRVAIADGATESSFAGPWARIVVAALARARPSPARIRSARRRWHGEVPWDRLPWFAAEKARQGAHAAVLALSLTPTRREGYAYLSAWSVGDCVLLWWRGERLHGAFPLERPEAFTNRPSLVGTGDGWPLARRRMGWVRRADRLLLATDAAALWCLRHPGACAGRLLPLLRADATEDLLDLVARERAAGRLRSDDTTWVLLDGG